MKELILTYVPESECLTFDEALALAEERGRQAAEEFRQSVPDSERFSGPVLVTQPGEAPPGWMFLTLPFPAPKVGPWDAKVIR